MVRIFSALTLVLFLAAGCESTRGAPAASVVARAADATFVVHGMSCPLCANGIDKQLEKVIGVETVAIDLDTGIVRVFFVPGAKPMSSELRQAIERSGFTVVKEGS